MVAQEKQIVWITGGGSGIGAAVAREYARLGHTVVVSGRRREKLDQLVTELAAMDTDALAVVCDVTDEQACEKAVTTIVERYGRLDTVFANAGYGVTGRIAKLSDTEWRAQFETNVFGLLNTIRTSLPALTESKGRIALTSSVMGFISMGGTAPYSASKYAVRAIGEALWLEQRRSGVSVTNVYPGYVASEIAQVDNSGVFSADRKDPRPEWLMWPTAKAARVIVRGINRRKRELIFTAHGKFAVCMSRRFPGMTALALRLAS